MSIVQKLNPCLWFDDQAEEAVAFYTAIFKNSRIIQTNRYSEVGFEIHGKPEGSVLEILFELEGQLFTALNGGPQFSFTEAISLQINCDTQEEVDYYWSQLSAGGDESAQQCGWLKDRYGLSWQVVPSTLPDLLSDHTSEGARRVMAALLSMKKLDIAALKQAYTG